MIKRVLNIMILLLLITGTAYSQGSLEDIQDFANRIYQHYREQSFQEVYAKMHPEIHNLLSKEDYEAYQQHHYERLRLEISDIRVGEVVENPRLPRSLQFLDWKDYGEVFSVEVSYQAKFTTSGLRLTQSVSKDVYILVADDGTMYSLWDPSVVNE